MEQNNQPPSEIIPNNSAEFGTMPNGAEAFRTVPNPSERFGNIPNSSEPFRKVPQHSESFRSFPHPSERKENHTLTVREAARMFEAAGVARTERSIVNWCQPNRLGVARLDSYFDPNERKYYLTTESVERAIQEEIQKASKINEPPASEGFGSVPKNTEKSRKTIDTGSESEGSQSEELEREVLDLKIANRAKDMFIAQLQKEREAFNEERQVYVKELIKTNRKVGELETKLLQLGAPKE